MQQQKTTSAMQKIMFQERSRRIAEELAGVASLRKLKDSSTKAVCSLQTQMECDCACF